LKAEPSHIAIKGARSKWIGPRVKNFF